MFKMKKTKSFVLALAFCGGLTAFVQGQEENQQQQQQMQQQPEQQDIDVEDEELEQFADIYQDVMQKNQEAQEEMVEAIKKEGLSVEDYQKMREADNNPEADDQDVSDEDLAKKENIDNKIQEMEPKLQEEQTNIIEDSDLSVDRYQEIAMALRSDQDLQQKLQKILMENDEGGQPQM